jgi:hypothetical protein
LIASFSQPNLSHQPSQFHPFHLSVNSDLQIKSCLVHHVHAYFSDEIIHSPASARSGVSATLD